MSMQDFSTVVPREFGGVQFRSTVESQWAALLDQLGVKWEYEPFAVELPVSRQLYTPDFYLPELKTFLEVKGPHNLRLDKPVELAEWARHSDSCKSNCDCETYPNFLVVVCRSEFNAVLRKVRALWEPAEKFRDIVLMECRHCRCWSFFDFAGWWLCRSCGGGDKPWRNLFRSDELSTFLPEVGRVRRAG